MKNWIEWTTQMSKIWEKILTRTYLKFLLLPFDCESQSGPEKPDDKRNIFTLWQEFRSQCRVQIQMNTLIVWCRNSACFALAENRPNGLRFPYRKEYVNPLWLNPRSLGCEADILHLYQAHPCLKITVLPGIHVFYKRTRQNWKELRKIEKGSYNSKVIIEAYSKPQKLDMGDFAIQWGIIISSRDRRWCGEA